MQELKGKTAVITGAASGIGRAIAHALARAGVNIVAADIDGDNARRVCDEIRSLGADALAVEVDVARRESVEQLADAAYDAFPAVDILVNNAGVTWRPFRTVLEASASDWAFLVEVNLWGVSMASMRSCLEWPGNRARSTW